MNLLYVDLPKWPQMIVTGVPLPVEYAKEVIRRTDSFFAYPHPRGPVSKTLLEMLKVPESYDEIREWQERWGLVRTSYVRNDWICSNYVGGPCGWVHPDGKIGFAENVGKWPSVGDIVADWETISHAFPVPSLGVTLMSGERCEENTKPLVSMTVHQGQVELVDPAVQDVHLAHQEWGRPVPVPDLKFSWDALNGLPTSWIQEWARSHAPP